MNVCMLQVQVHIYIVSAIYCKLVVGHNMHYGGCVSCWHLVNCNICYIHNLLIHSWADQWCFLLGLQYCKDKIIRLWNGLNFSVNMKNSPIAVFHVSFSGIVEVFNHCKPSVISQFLIMGTFSSSFNSYIFIWSMFYYIHFKLNNSIYLSGAFHLKDDCFRAGPLCLCLHISLRLAVFAPDMGHVSSSLITITTAVAAWIAAWVITGWVASVSCHLAWICIFSFISASNELTLSAFLETFTPQTM